MRLWSLHPKHLDRQGLVALWCEGLLAQAVLHGKTNGYKYHPQLNRFKGECFPGKIGLYLYEIYYESERRGYNFDKEKICFWSAVIPAAFKIPVTSGQLSFEVKHLQKKIENRSPDFDPGFKINSKSGDWGILEEIKNLEIHPLFYVMDGPVEDWEKY
jgi:hypothetical protein